VFHILSREAQDVPILNGRVDAAKVELLLTHVVPAGTVDHAFVCGPGTMLDDAQAVLKRLGLATSRSTSNASRRRRAAAEGPSRRRS